MREIDESKYPITRSEFERLLSSQDGYAIADGLDRLVYHEPELEWVQEMCLRHLEHPDNPVKDSAILGIRYLVRKHGCIDRARVIPMLERLRSEPGMGSLSQHVLSEIEKYAPAEDTNSVPKEIHLKA